MGPITLRLGDKARLCQIMLVILWVPTWAPSSTAISNGGGATANKETCTAQKCIKMAETMRRQMGSKEPCEDFHNYVCRKWTGDRELNSTRLKKKAVKTIVGLLKKASVPSGISSTADKLILAYNSCAKNGEDKEALKISVRNVIALYNLTSTKWPIIEETVGKRPVTENDYVDVLNKTGPRPMFPYSVYQERDKPIILMTKPWEWDFYVFDVEKNSKTVSETEVSSDYPNYDEEFAEDEKAYRTFIIKSIRLLNEDVEEQQEETVADDIITFEKQLSKLATAANKTEKQKMNLSELCDRLGGTFPMTDILRRDFEGLNISITAGSDVLVQYVDYYMAAVELLKCTRIVTLTNYLLWTRIRKMAEAEGTDLHKIYLEYKRNSTLLTNVDGSYKAEIPVKPKNLGLLCVYQLLGSDVMYTAVANYYITLKFNQTSKEDVLKMMKFVNSSFMNVVQNNTWMSKETKAAAITKLQNVNAIIGYPDWMLNETIINALYEFVPVIEKNASFVEPFYFLLENDHRQTLLQLDPERYFNKPNEDVPLRSHAYYVGRTNTMVYPAAALVTHYRSRPIPRSANYGTIGTILAQLLSKTIDRYDDLSKEAGKYNMNTWDNETAENFCSKSSCLNNTEECNDTRTPPSTDKYEKLHDYLGVRVSYQLYCPYSVNENRVEEKGVEARSDDGDKFSNSLNEIVYTYNKFNTTFNCTVTPGADTCRLMPPEEPNPPIGCK